MCYSRGMTIQTGDTVTIKRGKHSGQTGTVVAATATQAVVQLGDEYVPQNLTNIKAPSEPTITLTEVAALVNEGGEREDLVRALQEALPGLADKI